MPLIVPSERRAYWTVWYRKRRLLKLCVRCSSPADNGMTFCRKHRISHNKAITLKRRDRVLSGRCGVCKQKAIKNRKKCAFHLITGQNERVDRRNQYRKAGLCPSCGKKPEKPFEYCLKCKRIRLKIGQRYYRAKKESGQCQNCHRKRSKKSSAFCEIHRKIYNDHGRLYYYKNRDKLLERVATRYKRLKNEVLPKRV